MKPPNYLWMTRNTPYSRFMFGFRAGLTRVFRTHLFESMSPFRVCVCCLRVPCSPWFPWKPKKMPPCSGSPSHLTQVLHFQETPEQEQLLPPRRWAVWLHNVLQISQTIPSPLFPAWLTARGLARLNDELQSFTESTAKCWA